MPSTTPAQTGDGAGRPRLAPHVRLTFAPARQCYVVLTPETVTILSGTGAAILELCDGKRTVAEIVATLRDRYDRVPDEEVLLFLADLVARRRVEIDRG